MVKIKEKERKGLYKKDSIVEGEQCKENGRSHEQKSEVFSQKCKVFNERETPDLYHGRKQKKNKETNYCGEDQSFGGKAQTIDHDGKAKKPKYEIGSSKTKCRQDDSKLVHVNSKDCQEMAPDLDKNADNKKKRKRNNFEIDNEMSYVGNSKVTEEPGFVRKKKKKKENSKIQEGHRDRIQSSDGKESHDEQTKKPENGIGRKRNKNKQKERKPEGDKDFKMRDGQEIVPGLDKNAKDKKDRKRKERESHPVSESKENADFEMSDVGREKATKKLGLMSKKRRAKNKEYWKKRAEVRKKKIKKKKKKEVQIEVNQSKIESFPGIHPSLFYLHTWYTNREHWNFRKVRQVWLLQNMFDQEKIPDEDFSILLKYLEGLKGVAKEKTIEEAEKKIEGDTGEEDTVVDSRVRQVLQLLTE